MSQANTNDLYSGQSHFWSCTNCLHLPEHWGVSIILHCVTAPDTPLPLHLSSPDLKKDCFLSSYWQLIESFRHCFAYLTALLVHRTQTVSEADVRNSSSGTVEHNLLVWISWNWTQYRDVSCSTVKFFRLLRTSYPMLLSWFEYWARSRLALI